MTFLSYTLFIAYNIVKLIPPYKLWKQWDVLRKLFIMSNLKIIRIINNINEQQQQR